MKNTVLALLFGTSLCVVAFVSCATIAGPTEFDFNQLIGRWMIVEGSKSQIETWSAHDEAYWGQGVVLNKLDTTFVENLSIQKIDGNWVYQAKVFGQNNNQPISFQLENQTENLVAFSNYKHDFPQRIVYEMVSKDFLQVYIEGPRDGEKIRVVIDFKRSAL